MIPTLLRELTQAWRHARRTPFTTTASVLTLALGIGATTLLYGLLYGIVQRPLPYPDPASLVQISSARDEGGTRGGFSLAEFRDWQDESRSYASLALFAGDRISMLIPGDTARPVQGAVVSGGFFHLLGNPVRVGRPLTPDDDTLAAVVISERLWRTRLNADPDVLESTIVLDGQPVTIIGVADRTLAIPDDRTDLWLPVGFRRATAPPAWNMRGFRAFSVIARLESGVSLEQARDEAARIVAGWRERYPRFSENLATTIDGLRERLYGDAGPGLWLLFGCVGGAMLIAAFNVAGLLVARDASRLRETAVRRALGAGPGRLWRQSMMDSALLAAIGTAAGIGGADLGLQWLRARPPAGLTRLPSVVIDAPVLAVAVAIGTGVMLLLGTLLGWRAARTPALAVLQYGRGNGAGARRMHQILVVSQVALSFALLVGSLLLTSGLRRLVDVDTGLAEGRIATLTVAGARRPFFDRVLPEVAALPGIEAVGVTSSLPPHLSQMQTTIAPPSGSGALDPVPVDVVSVSPGTLQALGLRLEEGRFFENADLSAEAPVFVISARAAARLFPNRSAVGQPLPFGPSPPASPPPTVVGVVDDVRYRGLEAAPEGSIYMLYTQRVFDVMHLVVRSRLGPAAVTAAVRQVAAAADPSQAVADPRSLDRLIADAASAPRVRQQIVGALSALAVALAAVGLYGVVSETAASRRREFAVRAALGASPAAIRRQIITSGVRLVSLGVLGGMVPAYLLSRTLAASLGAWAVGGSSAWIAGGLVVLAVGLTASWWPAIRAANRPLRESLGGLS